MDLILSVGSVLLALLGFAFVILIHELGHFVFAKLAGVKVQVFSIGFPPTLWSRQVGETRYAIGLLPFGGYVKMLGQEDLPTKSDDEDVDPRSYANKAPGWRALILLGGVLFNLISAYLILVGLVWSGMPHTPATVCAVSTRVQTYQGDVIREVEGPAKRLGLRTGDRIRSINGAVVYGMDDVNLEVMIVGSDPVTMEVDRNGERIRLPTDGHEVRPVYGPGVGHPILGIEGPRSRTITQVAANNVGLVPGMRIDAVAGIDLTQADGSAVERSLLAHVDQEVDVQVHYQGETKTLRFRYAGSGTSAAWYGLPLQVLDIVEPSAGAQGLYAGDVIMSVDGQPLLGSDHLRRLADTAAQAQRPLQLVIQRYRNGAWAERLLDFNPYWDTTNGQFLLGIIPGILDSGPLPPLPETLGGQPHPLRNLLPPDSCLLDATWNAKEETVKGGDGVERTGLKLRCITGGCYATVTLTQDGVDRLLHVESVGKLSRLFGAGAATSLGEILVGATVASTGKNHHGFPEPGQMQVSKDGRILPPLSLDNFSPRDRLALLSLQAGDRILGFSRPVPAIPNDESIKGPGGPLPELGHFLEFVRGDDLKETEITVTPIDPGIWLSCGMAEIKPYPVTSWTDGFSYANHLSRSMILNTLMLIPRFFRSREAGGLDADKSLSGPVGIFSMLKQSTQKLGFRFYLKLVALIGLNLFLINLLPIPITDGGQLLILGIESAIRRPLPARIQNIMLMVGLILVVFLMLYTIGLDIARAIFGF